MHIYTQEKWCVRASQLHFPLFQGSWGSKKDLTAKDFLTLSIMSAVSGRKRRKRHNGRRVGSSTDDDSEHEPIKAGHLGTEEEEEAASPAGDTAPRAEAEEDDEDEEEEEEEDEEVVESGVKEEVEQEVVAVIPSRPCCKEEEEEEAGGRQAVILLQEEEARAEVKGPAWRSPEDARSIVSGYSTLSTLGRSLGSEGRGDDADDENSELVSETDNESGFASRSLTQERPDKHQNQNTPVNTQPPAARSSFLYTHYKAPVLSPTNVLAPPTPLTHTPDSAERSEGGACSTTPSSSSFSSSSTSHRLHSRPSFNSHKLIQCDTLARKKMKSEKAKAHSLDMMELSEASAQCDGAGSGSDGAPRMRRDTSRTNPSSGSSQESLRPARPKTALPPCEAASFTPTGPGGRSLAEQVRARLLGSADDLRSVGTEETALTWDAEEETGLAQTHRGGLPDWDVRQETPNDCQWLPPVSYQPKPGQITRAASGCRRSRPGTCCTSSTPPLDSTSTCEPCQLTPTSTPRKASGGLGPGQAADPPAGH